MQRVEASRREGDGVNGSGSLRQTVRSHRWNVCHGGLHDRQEARFTLTPITSGVFFPPANPRHVRWSLPLCCGGLLFQPVVFTASLKNDDLVLLSAVRPASRSCPQSKLAIHQFTLTHGTH